VSINDSGQVVGSYQPKGENTAAYNQGFVYSNGTYTTLTFPGAINTEPLSINAKGQVVGYYEVGDSNGSIIAEHGFLYSNGIYTTIDPPGGIGTAADSINKSGQIVGYSFGNGTENGFLATQTHQLLTQAMASFSPTASGVGSPLSEAHDGGMRLTDHWHRHILNDLLVGLVDVPMSAPTAARCRRMAFQVARTGTALPI
jgi:probable HAF family extracellular repeat protein